MDGGAWWAAVHGVTRSQTRLSDFTLFFHFHALEKEMATHSSVLAWRIPGMGEPGGLLSMGSQRVRHDWSDLAAAAAAAAIPSHCRKSNLVFRRKKRFEKVSVGRWILVSFPLWPRQHLSEHGPADTGAGRAGECLGTHAQLISRYISTQPYWLPRPFDQARRGFYYLKRLTAWAQWQVCHEENNSQKQMQGGSLICQQLPCVSGSIHPHQEKKKGSEKKEHLFPWSQFPCQTEHLSVFCVWNKQGLHTLKNNVKSSKGGELRILTWVNKRGLLIGRPSLGFTRSVSLGPGVMCGFDSLPLCFRNLVWNVAQS